MFKPEVVNIVSKSWQVRSLCAGQDEAESKQSREKGCHKNADKLVDTEPSSNSPDSATEGQREEKMMDMKKQIQHVEVALESMEKQCWQKYTYYAKP